MMLDPIFHLTNEEFAAIEEKFGKLIYFQAHNLQNRNLDSNISYSDITQEIWMSACQAVSYYKRQVYINNCFKVLEKYKIGGNIMCNTKDLKSRWKNRKHHGAGRSTFSKVQEQQIDALMSLNIPLKDRPNKSEKLKMDSDFSVYFKAVTWNSTKKVGRELTKIKQFGFVAFSDDTNGGGLRDPN